MPVNLQFRSDFEYQNRAVDAVADLFEGVLATPRGTTFGAIAPNPEIISVESLQRNLNDVQTRNGTTPKNDSETAESGIYARPNFSVEMETGTGKTYIFIRTILELNKRYGLKKFLIVVPSVAIREGVLQSLRQTKAHFMQLYDNRNYEPKEFSSDRLSSLSGFCRSNKLEIMVITLQSFNKDIKEDEKKARNVLYQLDRDDVTGFRRGIDMLAAVQPVVILDEPHKMGSDISKTALDNLNPLFVLRYSATHRDTGESKLVYSLGPKEALDLGLVKQIYVHGTEVVNESSLRHIKLLGIKTSPTLRAKVELKVRTEEGTKFKEMLLKVDDALVEKTKNPVYGGLQVVNFGGREGDEWIEFSGGLKVTKKASHDDTDLDTMREQIEQTILSHVEKQERLAPLGVKVLSLFFVDEVSDYMEIDESKGREEISKTSPKKYLFVKRTFDELFEKHCKGRKEWAGVKAEGVRGHYFSKKDTFTAKAQDKEMLDVILEDKQKLLSFQDSKIAFIFTHSALAEGWDNPNVFNICILRNVNQTLTKRQIIGRGLRIPVDQAGKRLENNPFNELLVVANEKFEDFARELQENYQTDGVFAPEVRDIKKRKVVSLKKEFYQSPFADLWKKIRCKSGFDVTIFTEHIIEDSQRELREGLVVPKPVIRSTSAKLTINENNKVTPKNIQTQAPKMLDRQYKVPDLLERVSERTGLTRKTVARILSGSGKLEQAFNNPEEFIAKTIARINQQKVKMELQSARYYVDGKYENEVFTDPIPIYESKCVEAQNSIYEAVNCDTPEIPFAIKLGNSNDVKVFCKLPNDYYIETPRGKYRPDWGIVFKRKEDEKGNAGPAFIVCETKMNYKNLDKVPQEEKDKIECAKKFFRILDGVQYIEAKDFNDFSNKIP